ncbi:MAG: FkbM family methyltransferase [Flavobacterium sp.]|nr:MAG: FkbM family methyltransferase [Flavobacterium sp.]
MKKLAEKVLIKVAKLLNIDLLSHAHVQIGVGHNTYNSGEEFVLDHVIKQKLKRDPELIFDIGANIGSYALALAQQFPDSRIYCFEPVMENFQNLTRNTSGTSIICENIAMSNNNEPLKLYRGSNDEDGSMCTSYKNVLESVFTFAGKASSEMTCEAITIDSYCKKNKIESIDFLKIDIEGHEMVALEGATEMLKEDRIKIIQFEFNEFHLQSRSTMLGFYQLLNNFNFYRIMPNHTLFRMGEYNSIHEIYRYQNILCLHKFLENR